MNTVPFIKVSANTNIFLSKRKQKRQKFLLEIAIITYAFDVLNLINLLKHKGNIGLFLINRLKNYFQNLLPYFLSDIFKDNLIKDDHCK